MTPQAAPPLLNEFLWTAVGVTIAIALMQARRMVAAKKPAQPSAPAAEPPPPEPPRVLETTVSPESHELAMSLAEELASLVTAVEGRSHHLIEAAPTRTQLPAAAEAMLAAVRRLQTLHTKLVAFGRGRKIEQGTTDVAALIGGLGDELQQLQLGLELRWEPPPELPRVDADPDAVRDALLFVCAALLRAERGATRLTFSTERSFSRERPTIKVELNLEWITVPEQRAEDAPIDQLFALDWEAAKHLVHSYGGELTMSHLPGKAVHAVVRLPIAVPQEQADEATSSAAEAGEPDAPDDRTAGFGGALVLESDPALRAVLARELKASGRAVFACADGAAAHTFLQATPDRFELLIVDDAQQLQDHTPLARTIRSQAPSLKICLLTPTPPAADAAWPDLHCLQKPFGVHELRRTLASILVAG